VLKAPSGEPEPTAGANRPFSARRPDFVPGPWPRSVLRKSAGNNAWAVGLDDHARAARLAAGLRGAGVTVAAQHTNMVFIEVPVERLDALRAHMQAARVTLSIGYTPSVRLVTHLDVDDDGVQRVVDAFTQFQRAH